MEELPPSLNGVRNSSPSRSGPLKFPGAFALLLTVCLIALLSAAGTASAQTATFTGAQVALATMSSGGPMQAALDSSGNLYIASNGSSYIMEFTEASGYTSSTALKGCTGTAGILGLAIHNSTLYYGDGGGNLYSAPLDCSSPTKLGANASGSMIESLAFDSNGNLFYTANNSVVYEATGAYSSGTVIYSSFTQALGLAFDSSNNLYVTDGSAGTVTELTESSSYATVTTIASGMTSPRTLAFDSFTTGTASNIYPGLDEKKLTLVAGPRYTHSLLRREKDGHGLQIFAQSLGGIAHGYDSIYPATGGVVNSATSYALQAGGGLNYNLKNNLGLRLLDAEYVRSAFPNAAANVQNDFRLGAGFVVHFGRR